MLADGALAEVEGRRGPLEAAPVGHCHEAAQRRDVQYVAHVYETTRLSITHADGSPSRFIVGHSREAAVMLMTMNQQQASQQPMLTCRRWMDLARCEAAVCRAASHGH
ncbi:hypothetical protein GCM10023349_04040 [Nocardioides conyzicola]|uniref:Uncharacterized protein n=1 Tax=Nocardioides conyzicola TaxID=1651781 RepID=A0ABP8WR85_9ACTN